MNTNTPGPAERAALPASRGAGHGLSSWLGFLYAEVHGLVPSDLAVAVPTSAPAKWVLGPRGT
jgi:hypothetical protein